MRTAAREDPSLFLDRFPPPVLDLLLIRDRTIYPIEIKKTAAPRPGDVAAARALGRAAFDVAPATVVCLAREAQPIARDINVVPAGWL